MATAYTNLNDILKQYEQVVVKGNHYTKSQCDTNFQPKTTALSSLSTAVLGASSAGLIVVTPVAGGAATVSVTSIADLLYTYDATTQTLTLKGI